MFCSGMVLGGGGGGVFMAGEGNVVLGAGWKGELDLSFRFWSA